MILTKLEMPLASRHAACGLRDAQYLHSLISGCFGTSRKAAELLYRVRVADSTVTVYVYSSVPPTEVKKPLTISGQRDLAQWLAEMTVGRVLGFDLLAAPSKKVVEPGMKNSKRKFLSAPEERLRWLLRKAEQNGFELLSQEEVGQTVSAVSHKQEKGGFMRFSACRFTGILRITDAEAFQNALCCGIGPEKAYGCGMLLIKLL